jgi:hypothetical protein
MISKTRRTDLLGWKCSSCAKVITSIEDGWVEWLTTETERGTTLHGLRLVHKEAKQDNSREHSCRYDARAEFRKDQTLVEGLPLERFMGSDGLTLLLSFLAAGEMPRDDVLELTKRLQVPGYELTRELFAALDTEMFTPSVMRGYYLQVEIRALLEWARRDSSLEA